MHAPMADASREAGRPQPPLMDRRSSIATLDSVLGAILGTAALIFMARNLGAAVLGELAFSLSLLGMLSFLADFGIGSVHRRTIREGTPLGRCIGAYAIIKAGLLGILVLVGLGVIEAWRVGWVGGAMPQTETLQLAMHLFLVYYVLVGLTQIATHTFEALDESAKSHLPNILETAMRVIAIIIVAAGILQGSPDLVAYLASAYLLGILASAFLVLLLFRRYSLLRPDGVTLRLYIHRLFPVFIVTAFVILSLYLDKVLLGYFSGAVETGLYFGVQRLTVFVGTFALSMGVLILPSLAAYASAEDQLASLELVSQAERYVSLIVVPIAAFYFLFGTDIIRIFLSDSFLPALGTMHLLVLAAVLSAYLYPLRSAVAAHDRPRLLYVVGGGGLLVQLVASLVLIPTQLWGLPAAGLGAFGAALAVLLAVIYMVVAMFWLVVGVFQALPTTRVVFHLLSAAAMVGGLYILDLVFWETLRWYTLLLLVVLGALLYGAVGYGLGELERRDYRYFRALLDPRETWDYVSRELLGK